MEKQHTAGYSGWQANIDFHVHEYDPNRFDHFYKMHDAA